MSHCPHLPLSAVMQASHAAIKKYLLPVGGGRSAANPPHASTAVDRRDRKKTDGWTLDRFTDPALAALAVSIRKQKLQSMQTILKAATTLLNSPLLSKRHPIIIY